VGRQVTAEPYPSLQSRSFEWKPSTKEDTIRISPKGSPNIVFRHRGFELYADPYNPGDGLLVLDSSFYVRAGNADANQVSFESVNFPGRFLRHAGFRLFLHPKDGSALFNADSTFQPIAEGATQRKVNRNFFKDRMGQGWRRLPASLDGRLTTISIGSDGSVAGTRADGQVFFKQNVDAPWGIAYMSSIKSVDCASRSQIIGTAFDGSVYRYGNNTWTKLPFQNVTHASVSGDGSIAFMTRVSDNVFNSQYSVDGKTTVWGGFVKWLSLGPLKSDVAVLNTDGTTTVFRNNPDGERVRRDVSPPLDAATKVVVTLAKVFMSKSSNKEVMALSTTGRLFGLDVDQKWSEIPNPYKVDWAGFNAERIVGCLATNLNGDAWTKKIKSNARSTFTVVANTVMGGTRTVPYTNSGLEELKKECRETAGCIGFNYSATKKEGTFVFGNETGAIPAGAIDGIHVGKSVPILKTVTLPTGERVYVIEDGIYTKLVSTSGVAKYYKGISAEFDPSRWNTYTNNPGNYIAMVPQEYAYYRKTG